MLEYTNFPEFTRPNLMKRFLIFQNTSSLVARLTPIAHLARSHQPPGHVSVCVWCRLRVSAATFPACSAGVAPSASLYR